MGLDADPFRAGAVEHFADSRLGAPAVMRLHSTFERSRNPMLLADERRRWVSGNGASSELLGLSREELPWHKLDEFTPASEREQLDSQWDAFLDTGSAEGWYQLATPQGPIHVEFSATAAVLPGRHLMVFLLPDEPNVVPEPAWTPVTTEGSGRLPLTRREREVMSLVSVGQHTDDLAEVLFLSPETVKSHVKNAMGKLGAHTRAHAVAIALMTGQISMDADSSPP